MIRALPRPRRLPSPRSLLLVGAAALLVAAAATALAGADTRPTPAPPTLSERLGVETWGLAIPVSWLAAPIPGLREEDVLDLMGTRAGERATASEVATGLRVMSADDRVVVVELTDDDAAAIAAARARGLALVPLLRSRR